MCASRCHSVVPFLTEKRCEIKLSTDSTCCLMIGIRIRGLSEACENVVDVLRGETARVRINMTVGAVMKWVEDFFFDTDNVEVEGGQFLKI